MKKNLIFVHGFRGNHLGLEELATKYFPKKDYNIFLPDIPPAGKKTLNNYSMLDYVHFLMKYIKKNKIEKPILVGHSMGSTISAAFAERYPEILSEKIIFLAPISVKPNKFFAMLTPLTAILPNKLIGYITTKYLFVPKDKNLLKSALKITYLCGADHASKIDVFKSAKLSASCSIADFDIKTKALFLSGSNDRLIPKEKTEYVAKRFDAKNIYINGAGHLLNYEKPKETATAIKRFLKK